MTDGPEWGALTGIATPMAAGGSDIWRDVASYYAPTSMQDAFKLCEFLYLNNSTYRKGSERVVDYFLTSLKVSGADDEGRKRFQDILIDDVKVMPVLRKVGVNFQCYGNAIVSPHFPFVRSLVCRSCGTSVSAKSYEGRMALDWNTGDIDLHCRKCKSDRPHKIVDRAHRMPAGIKLICWDPKRIKIKPNDITGDAQYWMEPTEYTKRMVRDNDPFFLSTLPQSFLETIRLGARYKFDPHSIFHLKESTIAGVDLRGWGPPPILSAFRNFFRLQVLLRQDEKLMMDYITPMRLLSPKQGSYVQGNSIHNESMANFTSNMGSVIRQHRISGMNWNIVPFPVDYQALGGEGQALSPREIIEGEEDRILNSRGVPPEFYRATLSLQAAPVALRLFERSWSFLVEGTNELLQWWSNHISGFLSTGEYRTKLDSVTVVDDIDNKIWRLQAMAAELLSKETALSPMGIDSREEFQRILDQQKMEAEMTERAQREMEMSSLSLDAPAEGGEEEVGGQGGGRTPEEVVGDAEAKARELLAMPEQEKNRQLADIRATDEQFHALVRQKMDRIRNQAASIGKSVGMQAALQQPLPPQQ